ncbi:MAG: alpha/beta fold hydrolase [Actinomycetota bacterium]
MKRRFSSSGGEIAYIDEGQGPAILLLHGFPTSSFLWREFVPPFAARFRVIAPDLLGYGESEKPQDADLSMAAQARYVREMLEALGVEEFAAVGHDLGGVVAQLLALEDGAKAMVLLDAAAFDRWPIEGVRMLQATKPEDETEQLVTDVMRLTLDLGTAHTDRLTDEVVETYTRPFVQEPAAFFRAVRSIDGKGLAGCDDELAALDLPTLLVWGEDDPFVPVDVAERLNDLLPGSTLALLPGCSHFVTEDAPQAIVPIVYEWLRAKFLGEAHGHATTPPLIQLRPLS